MNKQREIEKERKREREREVKSGRQIVRQINRQTQAKAPVHIQTIVWQKNKLQLKIWNRTHSCTDVYKYIYIYMCMWC